MGRKRTYSPLNVYFNARSVGQLTKEASGAIHFSYTKQWLEWPNAFPVSISLPLSERQYTGAQVSAVFDNLLPDYEPIRKRVAERVGAKGTDAFSLLTEIGRDCVGALQFIPSELAPPTTGSLTSRALTNNEIGDILSSLDISPLGLRDDTDFRISIAGAQEKTALLRHDNQWFEPTGTTPTTHILKPQIGNLSNGMDLSHSVENEFYCMTLMKSFNLKTANVEMTTFGNKKALVIERFDRQWHNNKLMRLPQEDLCQALSVAPTRKYQQEGGPGIIDIMSILRASDEPLQDRHDFFKANILFWLIGATDGHAKNFSLALAPQGRFNLTPLYDVLSLQPSFDNKQLSKKHFKMAMRVGNSNQYHVETIQGRHFEQTGVEAGLTRKMVKTVIEDLLDSSKNAFIKCAQMMPDKFPHKIHESIEQAATKRLARLHSS